MYFSIKGHNGCCYRNVPMRDHFCHFDLSLQLLPWARAEVSKLLLERPRRLCLQPFSSCGLYHKHSSLSFTIHK